MHEHNTILINMYMFTWPHAEKMESISCSILVHNVARHAAVLPGVGMAARPGPPALELAAWERVLWSKASCTQLANFSLTFLTTSLTVLTSKPRL